MYIGQRVTNYVRVHKGTINFLSSKIHYIYKAQFLDERNNFITEELGFHVYNVFQETASPSSW